MVGGGRSKGGMGTKGKGRGKWSAPQPSPLHQQEERPGSEESDGGDVGDEHVSDGGGVVSSVPSVQTQRTRFISRYDYKTLVFVLVALALRSCRSRCTHVAHFALALHSCFSLCTHVAHFALMPLALHSCCSLCAHVTLFELPLRP